MFDYNKTWKQNILIALGDGKWKSHRQLYNALGFDIIEDRNKVKTMSSFFPKLIRSGHLVKAHAPDVLKDTDITNTLKYVYKATDKPFVVNFVKLPTKGDRHPTKLTTKSNARYDAYREYVKKNRLLE